MRLRVIHHHSYRKIGKLRGKFCMECGRHISFRQELWAETWPKLLVTCPIGLLLGLYAGVEGVVHR